MFIVFSFIIIIVIMNACVFFTFNAKEKNGGQTHEKRDNSGVNINKNRK